MKKLLLALALLALIPSAFAFGDGKGDYCNEMHEAFDNEDYELWKDTMLERGKNSNALNKVNEENFHIFVEAREARLNGNLDLASELKAELGLGIGNGNGFKRGR